MILPGRFLVGVARAALMVLPLVAAAACSSADVKSDALDGEWQLAGAPRGAPPQTISFLEPDRVSGNGGCNRYSGALVTDAAGAMRIGPVAATKMACIEDGLMQAEGRFFAVLEQVRGYALVSEDHLRLTGEDGRILIEFVRLAER